MKQEKKDFRLDETKDAKSGIPNKLQSKSKFKSKKKGKKGRFGKDEDNFKTKGVQFNDVTYYNKNTEIVKAYCNVPFNYILGMKFPNFAAISNVSGIQFTGFMSYIVDWITSSVVGTALNFAQDIMNKVKTILYTDMRRVNAGATNAIEAVDVWVSNLLAGIDIYCNIAYAATMFKCVNSFSWKNRMVPQEIFRIRGIDYADFVKNQAAYRGRFDTLVAYAQTIRTLGKYSFILAAIAEYMYIFKDEDTDTGREQLLIPVKAVHHVYDPAGTANHPGGMIRLVREKDLISGSTSEDIIVTANDTTYTKIIPFSKLLDIIEFQIKALVTDSDFNLIQADLEKAFGDSQESYIRATGIDDTVTPIKIIASDEFKMMFHNGNFPGFSTLPQPSNETNPFTPNVIANGRYENVVYQLNNGVETSLTVENFFVPRLAMTSAQKDVACSESLVGGVYTQRPWMGGFVDTNIDTPTSDDVIIMTRYKTCYKENDIANIDADFRPNISGVTSVIQRDIGSNFVVFGHLYVTISQIGSIAPSIAIDGWDNMQTGNSAIYYAKINQVNFAPICWNSDLMGWTPVTKLNNIRKFLPSELVGINEACFLGLWNLPDKTNI